MGDTHANGPDLDELRALLLRDGDGDGFPDAVAGPVWIADGAGPGDVDAAVSAAVELLARLADRALVLPVDARRWRRTEPGAYLGPGPPPDGGALLREGGALLREGGALLREGGALLREGGALLREGGPEVAARWSWGGGAAAARIGAGLLLTAPDGPALQRAVTAWLAEVDAGAPAGSDGRERPAGGFAASGGAPEALGVALRLALATTPPPSPLVVPFEAAAVRTAIDAALAAGTWQVRRWPSGGGGRVEVAGHDAAALGSACRWFAAHYPRLPDGAWLDDLDDQLTRFVRAETRDGRIAAVGAAAAAARAAGDPPTHAEAPSPPADAARALALPVRNSARDGPTRRWSTRVAWEGERLLAAAEALLAALPRGGGEEQREGAARPDDGDAMTIEAYASESLALRAALAERLAAAASAAGFEGADVRVRHAFRPALHWLLEEVVPRLPPDCAVLRVWASRPGAPAAPAAGTAAGVGAEAGAAVADAVRERWLRELHPVAELIEAARPDLRVELGPGVEGPGPRYEVDAVNAAGRVVASWRLEPPVGPSPLGDGDSALITRGGVRLWRDGSICAEADVATDADALWRWFVGEVLPDLIGGLDPGDAPPFHEIAIVATLSEPDDRLHVGHETDSMLESLHEDLYFGVLEAFGPLDGAAARRTSPGRILPFVRGAPGEATRAQVVMRAWGSGRTGVRTARGAWNGAPACDADVRLAVVEGRGDAVVGVVVEAGSSGGSPPGDGERAAEDAVGRLAWAARVRPALFPTGVPIALRVAGAAAAVGVGPFAAAPVPPPLPPRPLHPREVLAVGRALAGRAPQVRLRVPLESALGQPLVVLEIGHPGGPAVSRARRAAWLPGILLSARQHANEATSTQAAFAWLDRLLAGGALTGRANLVVHPLENPDGARLHAALCALAPDHMHHAARYTAFGADLQADPVVRGEVIPESRLRHEAARRWRPQLHLNDHGYPAHAWIRAQTGHVPRGFADWSLPVGHLTILISHDPDEAGAAALREELAAAVERALAADGEIGDRTRAQVRRSGRYRSHAGTPFVLRSGLPFWGRHRPPAAGEAARGPDVFAPRLTLITEVPDETVSGGAWHACVRGHALANEAVALRFLDWLVERT